MSYNSKYTGAQVEDALDKALTAVQPDDMNTAIAEALGDVNSILDNINGEVI